MRAIIAGGEVYRGAGAGDVGHGDDGLSREVEVRDAGSEGTSGGEEEYGVCFTGLAVAALTAVAAPTAIAAVTTEADLTSPRVKACSSGAACPSRAACSALTARPPCTCATGLYEAVYDVAVGTIADQEEPIAGAAAPASCAARSTATAPPTATAARSSSIYTQPPSLTCATASPFAAATSRTISTHTTLPTGDPPGT